MSAATAQVEPFRSAATGKLSDRVYDHVLGQIILGIFPVNSRLPPETKLADQLGISRPVIREALSRLREALPTVERKWFARSSRSCRSRTSLSRLSR